MVDQPRIDSRFRRLLAYLRHNGSRIVVDVALLTTWIIVAITAFEYVDYHRWLLYFVIFVGVLLYSRVTPPWERPYRSPDQPRPENEDHETEQEIDRASPHTAQETRPETQQETPREHTESPAETQDGHTTAEE